LHPGHDIGIVTLTGELVKEEKVNPDSNEVPKSIEKHLKRH
jgi:hypothetical protein